MPPEVLRQKAEGTPEAIRKNGSKYVVSSERSRRKGSEVIARIGTPMKFESFLEQPRRNTVLPTFTLIPDELSAKDSLSS